MKKAKISKILVAVDGSEFSKYAAKQAMYIAKNTNGILIALHVLPEGIRNEYFQYNLDEIPFSIKEVLVLYQKEIECMSTKLTQMCKQPGVEFKIDIANNSTSVAGTIVGYAEAERVDLIVAGARGKSNIKNMLLGSVASDIVTYAHCPVLIVK
jgi:nucleotide-binding universal stress UspA family protein